MPATVATLIFVCGILTLFLWDTEKHARTSIALWLPIIWVILGATASKWLQVSARSAADQLEGNPVQRNIFTVLLLIGLAVLVSRRQRTVVLMRANVPILCFFAYCALSCVWSDFPDIAFKRWIKALGDIVMVMVVLTERDWLSALKRFFARAGFLLAPISILLIQYYTYLGRAYKRDGRQVFEGVTNDKNMLGVICLLFGVSAVWRIIDSWRHDRKTRYVKRRLIAQSVLLLSCLWLLLKANSMSSFASFVFASGLIIATSLRSVARNRALVHTLVAATVALAAVALFLNVGAGLVQTLGRDPTLTGRTELWSEIVDMNQNPLIGTGFESFWMGERLNTIWRLHWWHPNEAHNGYLEVYLNLGWIGIAFLAALIVTGYRNTVSIMRREPRVGGLMLAYFTVGIIYSFTEAGFRLLNPVWIFFMMSIMALPMGTQSKPRRRDTDKPELGKQATDPMSKVTLAEDEYLIPALGDRVRH